MSAKFSKRYTFLFAQTVKSFMGRMNMLQTEGDYGVAVSSGVDSMALLHFLQKMASQRKNVKLHVLHVNHNVRSESLIEQNFLKEYCIKHNLVFHTKTLQNPPLKNFELWARNQRYKFFHSHKGLKKIFMAHHLDDSFEWSLMQRSKSSNLLSSIGIPACRGKFCRPFLCVSKRQIYRFAHHEKIKFFEDISNSDIKFERNYLRSMVIPHLKKIYPQILKHYVSQAQQILALKKLENENNYYDIKVDNNCLLIKVDKNKIYDEPLKNSLREAIKSLSSKKRGKIHKQLDCAVQMVKNNKKGPLNFSGGVNVSYFNGIITVTRN
ncbi:MAG: tRNA lysidine(34) synthetase TilS [Halobacteriovoraceae bacterium]|nr:tRNA lysidine(34) synthetase TilS [Halobacteriovoraceae bacterium]